MLITSHYFENLMGIFQDRDKYQTGKINYEQLEDIFRIYQVIIAKTHQRDFQGKIGERSFKLL